MMTSQDCLVAGRGPVGMAFALMLHAQAGEAVRITLCGPPGGQEARAYALNAASMAILKQIGVWEDLAPLAQPVLAMRIADDPLLEPVRLALLNFEAENGKPLAHILEGHLLHEALERACTERGLNVLSHRIVGFEPKAAGVIVHLDTGERREAALLAAADGAASTLRETANLGWVGHETGQIAIVATLSHEEDHEGQAFQHFLPSGPFALLPLPGGHRSAMVWSEQAGLARSLLRRNGDELLAEIEQRAGLHLGRLTFEIGPMSFPLSLGMARFWTQPHCVLLGDAAHKVHPLAGQGLNLGFQDAACLASSVAQAVRLGLSIGDEAALASYCRERRFDAARMIALTGTLNLLFSRKSDSLRTLRRFGLAMIDQIGSAKRFLQKEAAGRA